LVILGNKDAVSSRKGFFLPSPRQTHPARVAGVALVTTDLVSISRNVATGRATCRHVLSVPTNVFHEGTLCNAIKNEWHQNFASSAHELKDGLCRGSVVRVEKFEFVTGPVNKGGGNWTIASPEI